MEKMKYHTIPQVKKTVCTAEQKVAYNIAFMYREHFIRAKMTIPEAARYGANAFKQNYPESRYNVDAIFSALLAGLENYYKGRSILCTFEEIGKTFPAQYL